ncbi:MAG: hypothetical protein WAP35_06440 [Solirubrobacterales bacterium]
MVLVAAIVLGIPALALWTWLVSLPDQRRWHWREAFALTTVAWALYSVAAIWILSIGAGHDLSQAREGHLTRAGLLAVWTLPGVAGSVVLLRKRAWLAGSLASLRSSSSKVDRRARVVIAASVFCVAVVGVVALLAAPNNWDSMTYHLSRVVAWLRLGGVTHYATNVEPQLYQPPGSEMLIAQWQALTGSDRMAASVQWFAFAGSGLIASLAAARLGAGRWGQVIAAFLVVTMPMAMMQGSSTQNDLITGFWLLGAATLAIGPRATADAAPVPASHTNVRVLAAGAALGLAVLTKGTALIYALPVSALLAYQLLRGGVAARRIAVLAMAGLLVLLPSLPHALANHQTFDSYLGTGSAGNVYKNEKIGPATLVSNLVRNASIHTKVPGADERVEDLYRSVLTAVSINPDDPANTFGGIAYDVGKFGPHEDHAPNLILMLLGIAAVFAAIAVPAFRSRRRLAWALVIGVQVLLFCLLFKWQVWHSRLHLPVFVLIAPLAAVWLEKTRGSRLVAGVLVLIALAAPVYLFYNYTRPLVGPRSIVTNERSHQMFFPRRDIEAPYRAVVNAIKRDKRVDVGLIATFDDWIYPFHELAGDEDGAPRIREIEAGNPSARYAVGRTPDTIICLNCDDARKAMLASSGYKLRLFRTTTSAPDANLAVSNIQMGLWER